MKYYFIEKIQVIASARRHYLEDEKFKKKQNFTGNIGIKNFFESQQMTCTLFYLPISWTSRKGLWGGCSEGQNPKGSDKQVLYQADSYKL